VSRIGLQAFMYFAGAVLQGTHPPRIRSETHTGRARGPAISIVITGWAANAAVKGPLRRPLAALDCCLFPLRRSLPALA
jgi:hypothetical protein